MANPFERIVEIVRHNDRLMAELGSSRRRLFLVKTLAMPRDLVDTVESQHRAMLATLRANRLEALILLAAGESEEATDGR